MARCTEAGYYRDIAETDPDTALAWMPGGVNAMQVGIEVVS
jgi:hypothetical protein